MTKNDFLFKILFALEMALIPLVACGYFLQGNYLMMGFMIALVILKAGVLLSKDPSSTVHNYIQYIGDAIVNLFTLIWFTSLHYIPVGLCVAVCIVIVIYTTLKCYYLFKPMNDIIESIDFCYDMFSILLTICMTFIFASSTATIIAILSILMCMAISGIYKLYRYVYALIANKKGKKSSKKRY